MRDEADPERFEMDWRRAGGVPPEKESWGSWIKRGVTEATGVVAASPASEAKGGAAAAAAEEEESWGSWIKRGVTEATGGAGAPSTAGRE